LIVTAAMNDELHSSMTELRDKFFPREINYLEAHITLFHQFPDRCETQLKEWVREQKVMQLELSEPVFLGFGFGVKVESPPLKSFYLALRGNFLNQLSKQDAHKKNLHITLQNKVEARQAKKECSEFSKNWQPMSGEILGLNLYHYLGGPWEKKEEIKFRS
tara:strand:- start:2555 stop:3037 length:483 start_codon:yes stop_codon:yes gene_type:complete